jgi:syntaxin 7
MFLDRVTHEQLIAKKFVAVDQATVMQEIIEERSEEITKVKQGLLEVNEMFEDLAHIVKTQQVEIDAIYDQAENTNAHTAEAFKHIVNADKLQNQQNCVIS